MKLIGIAGQTASGKTTIARGLITHFKAETNRFSHILANIANEAGLPTDKASLQTLSTALRFNLGESVLAHGMCEWVKKRDAETVTIEGLRRRTDIQLLALCAKETGREWTFLYVDVSFEIRFERYKFREGDMSLEDFTTLDEQECETELPLLKPEAHLVVDNTSQLPDSAVKQAINFIEINEKHRV